jgi:hypothetical protein
VALASKRQQVADDLCRAFGLAQDRFEATLVCSSTDRCASARPT